MTEEQRRIDRLEKEIVLLREQLEQANASNMAKEAFLSNMSHDIRTPMNAIVGMTALAKKHIDEKSRVKDALEKIETASGHLLDLINGVLDMSRINSGRMVLSSERFSLSDLLYEIMAVVRPQIEQKKHHFSLGTDHIAVESFYGDSLRIRQIMVNILSNAVKYTDEGGRISFSVSETMEGSLCHLHFVCTDSGMGMDEAFLKRIFEPFERANSTTIANVEGTGLGMSIVKKLVDAMDGRITIESEPGRGTSVSVTLPLQYEQETVRSAALAGKRFLILESDTALQVLYRQYLTEYELEFSPVSTVGEAFDALADADITGKAYHCMIIGNNHTGDETVLDIASYLHKSFPDLVLILVGDNDWEEIEYRAGRCGIRGFIPVPFFRKSLINGLAGILTEEGQEQGGVPDLAGMHILLVEDNMINREIALEILQGTHAQIDAAADGLQALERFLASEEGYYDLILMDVQMPVMDGYTSTERIRESGRGDSGSVKIYAMTANTFAEDIAKARNAGMDGHIAKPIDINILMQTLRQVRQS